MAIKGLTDGSSPGAGLPLVARLYKGEPKPADGRRPGRDLDFFRVEFEDRFGELRDTWAALYGDKPTEFAPCFFANPTADEAFSSWYEAWRASGLMRRCDGDGQVLWFDERTGHFMRARQPCLKPDCDCRPVGRLNVLLPEFVEAAGVLGFVALTTHSVHDILTIWRYLADIERMYGRLTGVPFALGREKKQVSAPKTGPDGQRTGERIKITRSMLYIHVLPEFMSSHLIPALSGMQKAAEPPALPMPETQAVRVSLGNGGARRVGVRIEPDGDDPEEDVPF
jgi:hypothetical protein